MGEGSKVRRDRRWEVEGEMLDIVEVEERLFWLFEREGGRRKA